MIKPILFIDFDGTICHDKYWRSLSPAMFQKVQQIVFGDDRAMLNDWMKGKYTAEEVNTYLANELHIPFEELWNIFVEDCKTMQVSKEVLQKLDSLRSVYTVILITGNMDSFSRFTVPALQLDSYVDHINNSFFEGKFKSEDGGSLFMKYVDALGAPMHESVLIDDSAKICALFNQLGGKAYQVTADQDIMYHLEHLQPA